MLWALAQPAAVAGLVAAFGLGVALRCLAQRVVARLLGLRGPGSGVRFDGFGALAAALCGTGWGRPAPPPQGRRGWWAVVAGPVAVVVASQMIFAGYRVTHPEHSLALRLNRPSDVLHGAVGPTAAAQLILSVAVGLLCFGLLALLPVPPFDGSRLLALPATAPGQVVERLAVVAVLLLLVVPVAGRPPLLAALDVVAGPVVRAWA